MKLRKLLKYISDYTSVVIWHEYYKDEAIPAFEGVASDVPYWLTECHILPPQDTTDNTISCRKDEKGNAVMVILVQD